jgi:hypothetical protein
VRPRFKNRIHTEKLGRIPSGTPARAIPKAKSPGRLFSVSSQLVVTVDRRVVYLGPHDSRESIAVCAVLSGLGQAGGLPDDFDQATRDDRAAFLFCMAPAPGMPLFSVQEL